MGRKRKIPLEIRFAERLNEVRSDLKSEIDALKSQLDALIEHHTPFPDRLARRRQERLEKQKQNLVVGKRIRAIRKAMRMTLKEFSVLIGYSDAAVCYAENGRLSGEKMLERILEHNKAASHMSGVRQL